MQDRLVHSGAAPTPGYPNDPYGIFDDDDPTEEVGYVPTYITAEPTDQLHEEFVGLHESDRAHLRPEETIQGRTLWDDLVDPVAQLVDRVLLDPVRLLFTNLGFIVTALVVLGIVSYVMGSLINLVSSAFRVGPF